jgi:hypothetical protein
VVQEVLKHQPRQQRPPQAARRGGAAAARRRARQPHRADLVERRPHERCPHCRQVDRKACAAVGAEVRAKLLLLCAQPDGREEARLRHVAERDAEVGTVFEEADRRRRAVQQRTDDITLGWVGAAAAGRRGQQ